MKGAGDTKKEKPPKTKSDKSKDKAEELLEIERTF